jgi:hypothetical protein
MAAISILSVNSISTPKNEMQDEDISFVTGNSGGFIYDICNFPPAENVCRR